MSKEKFNCIFIPGGGLQADGSLPAWTISRLDAAIKIQEQTDWIATLSGGTVHKPPPLDEKGFPIFESRKAAEYLVKAGISPSQILSETSSYDTIGNAYFARMLFSEPMAQRSSIIITSSFHMARTEAIFRWIYSLTPLQHDYSLSFRATPDIGLSPQVLEARQFKEKRSLENLREKIQGITSLSEFQEWFHTRHAAYSAIRIKEELSEDELKSY